MSDLISRQAAIDEIEYELEMINSALDSITLDFNARERLRQRRGEAREILNSIQQLPSAQPEQRWIPCSERLPEGEELVLVTDDSGGIKTVDVDRCGQYENSNERFWYYTQNVVAWMPLPVPYTERREE